MFTLEPVPNEGRKFVLEPVPGAAEDDLLGQFNEMQEAQAKPKVVEVSAPKFKLEPVETEEPFVPGTTAEVGMDIGMELVSALNSGMVDMADFMANPFRVANELVQGRDLPTIREALIKAGLPLDGGYMRDGTLKDIVRAAGSVGIPVAAGLMPVQRVAGAGSSVLADIAGFGSSAMDDASKLAASTAQALKNSDNMVLGTGKLTSDEQIYDAAYQSAKRDVIERNRLFADSHEEQMAKVLEENKSRLEKAEKAGIDPSTVELISEEGTPNGITKFSMTRVLGDLEQMYGIDPNKTLRVVVNRKGINFDPDEVTRFTEADKQFTQQARRHGAETSLMDWLVTPMSQVLTKRVGPQVGGVWERAIETATRGTDNMLLRIGQPISRVMKYVDENPKFKAVLMDMHLKPQSKMKEARSMIERDLGKKQLKAFDNFIVETQKHNARARKVLYKPNEGFDDLYYIHTKKLAEGEQRGNQGRGWAGKLGNPANRRIEETMDRNRKPGFEMTEEELAQYENPLMSHVKHMGDSEHLMQVAEKFRLRPALGRNSKSGDVFNEVSRKLVRDGIDPARAEEARRIMNDAYMGSTMAPHPGIRAVMDLAYGGTLAQFKTALLNLHDIFVSMTNQGVRPTLKALVQSNKSVFGRAMKDMGFDSSTAKGEFVREFDTLTEPTVLSRIQQGTHWISRIGFKYSGFQGLDRIGKGVVVRSALNKARMAAQKGRLVEEWGDVLTKDELRLVRPFMMGEKGFTQMPKRVQDLVEEAVFTKLGQQQLISIAGRPLAYAQHPTARPMYAMSGFALKQLALIRQKVIHEAAHGSPKKAAAWAARYVAFGGLGYGLIDETRSAIFKDEEFEPEDILFGVLDQVGAALTLNRLGETYSLQEASKNPVDFLLHSVLPPMGLLEAIGIDAVDMILRGEYNAEVVKRAPVIGDFYKYYWSDKKERPTKAEAYEGLYEDSFGTWGEGE